MGWLAASEAATAAWMAVVASEVVGWVAVASEAEEPSLVAAVAAAEATAAALQATVAESLDQRSMGGSPDLVFEQ